MAEDKARDRVDSGDSARERNAVVRPREPDAARMGFFNGLIKERYSALCDCSLLNTRVRNASASGQEIRLWT